MFIGSDAMNAGKRSGWLRQTSASASLATRASSGDWSGGATSSSGGLARQITWLQVAELVEQAQPRIDVDQRLQPRKAGHRDVVGHELRQAVEIGLAA